MARTRKSRTCDSRIDAGIHERYPENRALLAAAGVEFGGDGTGYPVWCADLPDPDSPRHGRRIAGPASCAETVAESAVNRLGLRDLLRNHAADHYRREFA